MTSGRPPTSACDIIATAEGAPGRRLRPFAWATGIDRN
jgi:hypothetical protein